MGNRRRSRELALQALFYTDVSRDESSENLELFCGNFTPSKNSLPFFLKLVKGVIHNKRGIDSIVERFSSNWKISRMSCVDRNIIRIAVYELLYCRDIPPKVTINEAIEVGKRYGTEDSGAFINGILDGIRISLEKGDIDLNLNSLENKTDQ